MKTDQASKACFHIGPNGPPSVHAKNNFTVVSVKEASCAADKPLHRLTLSFMKNSRDQETTASANVSTWCFWRARPESLPRGDSLSTWGCAPQTSIKFYSTSCSSSQNILHHHIRRTHNIHTHTDSSSSFKAPIMAQNKCDTTYMCPHRAEALDFNHRETNTKWKKRRRQWACLTFKWRSRLTSVTTSALNDS